VALGLVGFLLFVLERVLLAQGLARAWPVTPLTVQVPLEVQARRQDGYQLLCLECRVLLAQLLDWVRYRRAQKTLILALVEVLGLQVAPVLPE
jgi:hypothetical protein